MAAVAKLLTVSAVACCRRPRHRPLFSSLRTGPSLRLNSTAVDSDTCHSLTHDGATLLALSSHPWPEWGRFIETLRGKGYFVVQPSGLTEPDVVEEKGLGEDSNGAAAGGAAADDVNKVKNACLKFGRERFDILRSLPKQDIQLIVECGCPNLFRKAVNSAKRLRAFLQLDEGKVCSTCKLRDSCDRADKAATDGNDARTVDVVRILLTYAIEPANLLGEHAVTVEVQESARKLLSNLIDLSNTSIDPALPKPEFNPKPKVAAEQSERSNGKKQPKPKVEMAKGDWLCPNCNFLNFARNIQCRECKTDGPKVVDQGSTEMKLGDWICPSCQYMNFARNKTCFRCEEARPKRELNPGEWECPSCSYINFRRNKECKRCSHDHPVDEDVWFNDHEWRKPATPGNLNLLSLEDKDDAVASSEQFGDDQSASEDESKLGAQGYRKQLEKNYNSSLGNIVNSPFERNKKFNAQNRGGMLREAQPRRERNPGEWECPSCFYLNFRQNKSCRKCSHDRPEREAAGPLTNHKQGRSTARRLATEKSLTIGGDETDDNILSADNKRLFVRSQSEKMRQNASGRSPSSRGSRSHSEFLSRNVRDKQSKSVSTKRFDLEDSDDDEEEGFRKGRKVEKGTAL